MEIEMLREWANFGVGGMLAALLFYWYRNDVARHTELWRGQSEMLLTVVRENTRAITTLEVTVRNLREDQSARGERRRDDLLL